MLVQVDASRHETLTEQIVGGIRRLVDNRELRPETRLPSIRQFAADHDVSKFTVVQAYDRLVATGHIQSRHGAGFFVCKPTQAVEPGEGRMRLDKATDVLWLLRQQARELHFKYLPGVGWLPPQWLADNGLERAMRRLAVRGARGFLAGYGNPRGYTPLREDVVRRLTELGIDVRTDQILLTNGIIGAIDLVGRYLIRPDDVVLVDDPGYFQTFGHIRALGATVRGVPWTGTGPDLGKLEEMVRTHHPRFFITTPIVQNPTGCSTSQGVAFRLLQLAERYDFYIVEDDVDGTCHPDPPPRLASLDQLNRVIYVNGFSKALSPRLRVGFLAAHRDLVQDLVDLKMLTQAVTSEFSERLVHDVLIHGHYRKHRAKLLTSLRKTREEALCRLEAIGLRLARDGGHGLFAWVDVRGVADTVPVAETAAKRDMLLAPGAIFSPDAIRSAKMRFNVAFCQNDEMFGQLDALLNEAA